MTERSVLIDKWLIELKKKSRNGVVSNKDIMDLIEKKDLTEDDLSSLYEALHTDNYEVNFDADVSDEDLEQIEEEFEIEEAKEGVLNDESSVTIDDPVKMYLKEIGAMKLLDSEEEIRLAKLVEKGARSDASLEDKAAANAAKKELADRNLRLVVSIAKKYLGRGMQFNSGRKSGTFKSRG